MGVRVQVKPMYKVNQKHSDSNKMKIIFLQKGLVGAGGQGVWEIIVTKFLFRNVLETVAMVAQQYKCNWCHELYT